MPPGSGRALGMRRENASRRCAVTFALERMLGRTAAPRRRGSRLSHPLPHLIIALRRPARARLDAPLLRRRQRYAGSARFGKPYRDRLPGRARAVFAATHVLDLLVHELSGGRGWTFSLPQIAPGAIGGAFGWHDGSFLVKQRRATRARKTPVAPDSANAAQSLAASAAAVMLNARKPATGLGRMVESDQP